MRRVLRDIERIGDDQFDVAARDFCDLRFPFGGERFGRRHYQFARREFNRQDMEAGRVGRRHHIRHAGEINLERINTEEGQFDLAGQPFGQPVQRDRAMRFIGGEDFALCDRDQRMHRNRCILENALGLVVEDFDAFLGDDAICQQPGKNLLQIQLGGTSLGGN
ncbi:hypothetical protein D3C81_1746090 [compost metagenome]